jgi:hypothetical protein
MINKKAQLNPLGVLIFILTCAIAGWLFFRMVDPNKGGALIDAKAPHLGDTVDMINLLDMYGISELIVDSYLSGDWIGVELKISDTLEKIYSKNKQWLLEVDGEKVASSGDPSTVYTDIKSDVWLPLPYNPVKRIVNVRLIVGKDEKE